jgi:alkyldihydroxyacetonephosphate synthase
MVCCPHYRVKVHFRPLTLALRNYMKRWNGWGDESITPHLSTASTHFLQLQIGVGTPPRDTSFEEVVERVPASRLPAHSLITTDPGERLLHARGQSLPDWIALRSGCIDTFPDGVAYPESEIQVRELISFATEFDARLIPYGGGTSVVGHINSLPGEQPVLTVDLKRMSSLHRLDETNQLATFGTGVAGLPLEARLRAQGYTLGHYPQSFEYSTLGGWIATRSSGQQSLGYGRIEQLFAGGRVETPSGTLEVPSLPAAAAGLDMREIILGSEGRLGILTEATVRVRPLPEQESFFVIFFPSWEQGLAAARHGAQARLPLTMLRLSTPIETRTQLVLAGHERVVSALERLLALRGAGKDKCMLMVGIAGREADVKRACKDILGIAHEQKGVSAGHTLGEQWHKKRFQTPYLRNTLWTMGYAVDTVETATTWDCVPDLTQAIETALRSALKAEGEEVHAFTHLSHLYPHGSAIYTTYLYRIADSPDETLHRWQVLKNAASQAIVAGHGTISHQHGIGTDHQQYLIAEKGPLGLSAMRQLYSHFDPEGIMNPGKLVL